MSEQKAQAPPKSVTSSGEDRATSSARDGQNKASASTPNLGNDSDVPPPEYGASYGAIDEDQNGLGTRADVTGLMNLQDFSMSLY